MNTQAGSRHSVVVVGAGQTGLASGYHLARRGMDFVVLEAAERVGDVWRERYDSLRLYSPAKYDALPGLRFPLPRNSVPTGREMGEYLEAYARHHRLPVETGVQVTSIRAADAEDPSGGFVVSARDRTYLAEQVIVASGVFQHPNVPEFAAELDPGIRQLHAREYRNPGQLRDGPVLVVGLGHSGADLALEAARAGHQTSVSGRAHGELPFTVDSRRARIAWPILRFVARNVLTLRTPVGRRMAPKVRHGGGVLLRVRRRELLAAGVTLHEERTVGADPAGHPLLANGTALDVANVIWCTGYRPDFSWIHLPVLGKDGWPRQDRGVVESVPGLYVLGVPFLYSFASILVLGAARDAAHIVARAAVREAQLHAAGRERARIAAA